MWSNDPSPPCLPNYYQIKWPKSKRRFKEPCLKLWTNKFGQTEKHAQIWSLICIFKKIQISFPDTTDCIQDTLTDISVIVTIGGLFYSLLTCFNWIQGLILCHGTKLGFAKMTRLSSNLGVWWYYINDKTIQN